MKIRQRDVLACPHSQAIVVVQDSSFANQRFHYRIDRSIQTPDVTASISDSYRDLNKSLHKDEKYGSRADAGGLAGNLQKRFHDSTILVFVHLI